MWPFDDASDALSDASSDVSLLASEESRSHIPLRNRKRRAAVSGKGAFKEQGEAAYLYLGSELLLPANMCPFDGVGSGDLWPETVSLSAVTSVRFCVGFDCSGLVVFDGSGGSSAFDGCAS